MADYYRHKRKPTKKPKRYKGIMQWLDTEGVGYIICGEIEVFVTQLSLSSDTIKQGDKVSFSVKTRVLKPAFEAIDVERFGVECHRCLTGHYSYDCPDNVKYYWINCYKCGFIGHYSDNCDQKLYGWVADNDNKSHLRDRFIGRSCDCGYGCWLSLFGGPCRKLGIGNYDVVGSSSNLVLGSFHYYWPHLIESCFNSNKNVLGCNNNVDGDGGGGDNDDDDGDKEEGLRCIVCVKKEEEVKKVEEVEDCFVLEFDPNGLPNLGNLSLRRNVRVGDDEDDLCIVAEKGQVACRDYPHSRHLCGNNPFKNTPHESHCKMCYCYICDIPAPCKKWSNVSKDHSLNHCDASDDIQFWRTEKDLEKKRTEVPTLITR